MQPETQLSVLSGRYRGEPFERQRRAVGGMKCPVPGPFEPRDIGQVGQCARGLKAGEKPGERVAEVMQVAARGWMVADVAVGGVGEEARAHQPLDYRVNRLERADEAFEHIVAIDLQMARGGGSGRGAHAP